MPGPCRKAQMTKLQVRHGPQLHTAPEDASTPRQLQEEGSELNELNVDVHVEDANATRIPGHPKGKHARSFHATSKVYTNQEDSAGLIKWHIYLLGRVRTWRFMAPLGCFGAWCGSDASYKHGTTAEIEHRRAP